MVWMHGPSPTHQLAALYAMCIVEINSSRTWKYILCEGFVHIFNYRFKLKVKVMYLDLPIIVEIAHTVT